MIKAVDDLLRPLVERLDLLPEEERERIFSELDALIARRRSRRLDSDG